MTNNEMLMAAIEFEEVEFAFDLFYLISHGHLDANAKYDSPNWNLVDKKVVNEMMKQNLLGFDIVNIYCIRLNVEDYEIFFAKNEEQARGYALNKYRFLPKIVQMDKSKYLKEFYFQDSKEYKSLLQIRQESNVFPRHAMVI